jgi:hypothetical protein
MTEQHIYLEQNLADQLMVIYARRYADYLTEYGLYGDEPGTASFPAYARAMLLNELNYAINRWEEMN